MNHVLKLDNIDFFPASEKMECAPYDNNTRMISITANTTAAQKQKQKNVFMSIDAFEFHHKERKQLSCF